MLTDRAFTLGEGCVHAVEVGQARARDSIGAYFTLSREPSGREWPSDSSDESITPGEPSDRHSRPPIMAVLGGVSCCTV